MSHSYNCPSDYEARRAGERAFENGRSRSSNPYDDEFAHRSYFDEPYCPDAASAFDRGYRAAEREAEERAAEAAAERRRAEERHWHEMEEYEFMQQQQYEEDMRRHQEECYQSECGDESQ